MHFQDLLIPFHTHKLITPETNARAGLSFLTWVGENCRAGLPVHPSRGDVYPRETMVESSGVKEELAGEMVYDRVGNRIL
jgi:hypothetical protein